MLLKQITKWLFKNQLLFVNSIAGDPREVSAKIQRNSNFTFYALRFSL